MKTILKLSAAVCCSLASYAATPPLPSFQEKAIGHPPLSLNETLKEPKRAKPFEFGARLPRFTDGLGTDNPLLRDLQPRRLPALPEPAPPPSNLSASPATARRVPNHYGSRMPVIAPSDSVDYKMAIVPPDPNIDFKMLTIETGTPEKPAEKK